MRTSNPALGAKTFVNLGPIWDEATRMTVQGTVNKTAILLLLALLSAFWTWQLFFTAGAEAVMPWLVGGGLGGMVVGLVTIFKKEWAIVTGPLYALLEGLMLGGLSSMFEVSYPGIVIQAVGLTFGVFASMLLVYTTRLIRVTDNLRLGIVAATGGIALVYLVNLILGLFGMRVPFIHESGPIGIGVSVFVVMIAALNLVLDFDFIEQGAAQGAPKYMEWYAAFGLIVTLVWLYIEILRLLRKVRGRK